MKPIDISGQRFGKLVAISWVKNPGEDRKWLCQCDCGKQTYIVTNALRNGNSKACGHCRTGSVTSFKPLHGAAVARTPTYESWRSMRVRCRKRPEYAGVSIDPSWDDFETFLADMGERPDGMTLDRKDNARGYSKENCRWATPTQQTRNRRIAKTFTWNGRTLHIAEWAAELGISYNAALCRIRRRNSLELPSDAFVRTMETRRCQPQ